jgi:predicted phosphodiesterase
MSSYSKQRLFAVAARLCTFSSLFLIALSFVSSSQEISGSMPAVKQANAQSITESTNSTLQDQETARHDATNNTSNFNFIALGDWGCTNDTIKNMNYIIEMDPEIVLGLGDFSYETTADCWLDIIEPIDAKMKIVLGNHDSTKVSADLMLQYMDHFNLSSFYYSFDYKNVHFLGMSTEHSLSNRSDQFQFVKDDLAKASADPDVEWIVVYYHNMMYHSNTDTHSSRLRDTYHELFDQYDVDLALQGHQHNYERSYPLKYNSQSPLNPTITDRGINNNYLDPESPIFATVGTGGVSLHSLDGKKPFIASQHEGYGVLNIEVINDSGGDYARQLMATFYSTSDGRTIDQFAISKR